MFFKRDSCYRPQLSCGKVMFSQASVILFTEGVSARHHPAGQTPCPLGRHPPRQTPPPGKERHPPPCRRLLQRTVRILLECIVYFFNHFSSYLCADGYDIIYIGFFKARIFKREARSFFIYYRPQTKFGAR